jgi:hypothetical protein
MSGKRISLLVLLLALFFVSAGALEARNYVVPTYYGYGVVNSAAYVRPYISSYYPYAAPTYAYNGYYYNYYNVAPVVAPTNWASTVTPAWNGFNWYYYHNNQVAVSSCNLNIRSEPYVAGKKRTGNVISSLKTGEQVYILGQAGNWYMIQSVLAPLRRGYVYGPYLQFYSYQTPVRYSTLVYPAVRRIYW